jgi:CheY-like chemotaxis protein
MIDSSRPNRVNLMSIAPARSHNAESAAALLTEAPHLKVPNNGDETHVPPQLPNDARLRTLLYIEDDPANVMLIEQIIARRTDLRLLTAVNGILGIEVARASRPDVILLDINLPGISGIDVLKILHEDPATAHIPIVALSANTKLRDIQLGFEVGFFWYVTKPIKIKEFMETLNTALEFFERKHGAHI